MQMRATEGTLHTLYIVSKCFQKVLLCVGNLIFNSAIRFVNLNSKGVERVVDFVYVNGIAIQDLIFARVPVCWRCLCFIIESLSNDDGDVNENGTTAIGLECVPLGWSVSGSVIGDHSDHGRSNEAMNPLWTRIRRFIWSTWSQRITDPDSDRPKETHP